ncbi:hypothetical protein [Pseudarthrobacter oxydans]|uniref:hypothetical protein n=1 Tax=Pseudarthrobacter oxydans TaxID=1671 RepID=UPI00344B4975
MDNDDLWVVRLQRAMEAVREWEKRIGQHEEVAPRSSLDTDDRELPRHPVQSAAWYGLVTAVDHLALGADLADKGLTLRPSSIFTVTRAALLGASQAVWVLSGGREDRRGRALSIESDERKQHRGFIKDYANDPFIREHKGPEFVAALDALVQRLTDDIQGLRALRKGRPYDGDFVSTMMMREAATYLADTENGDDWLRLALAYEWRLASAAAHARSWPFHVRRTERTPLANGGELRQLTSSLAEVVQSYGAAVLMTSEAWRLWDLRRHRHV